jgi:hypothetical protein
MLPEDIDNLINGAKPILIEIKKIVAIEIIK